MTYKVFLVEDEVTTREGIRDNVDWRAMGFELCGEAPDGEIALPQIETLQPDVLITDIKMPFMDGLQLSKIIREHFAWMKIIIISGHNDFQYAQTAIKLGVTEYLLKPVSVQDLQIRPGQSCRHPGPGRRASGSTSSGCAARWKIIFHFCAKNSCCAWSPGANHPFPRFEQSQQLGLNIFSPYYQVILARSKPR